MKKRIHHRNKKVNPNYKTKSALAVRVGPTEQLSSFVKPRSHVLRVSHPYRRWIGPHRRRRLFGQKNTPDAEFFLFGAKSCELRDTSQRFDDFSCRSTCLASFGFSTKQFVCKKKKKKKKKKGDRRWLCLSFQWTPALRCMVLRNTAPLVSHQLSDRWLHRHLRRVLRTTWMSILSIPRLATTPHMVFTEHTPH